MALNLNSNTLVEDYDFVWVGDAALDRAGDFDETYQKYIDTGDASLLPVVPGQKPILWRLRHLRGRARKRILDAFLVTDGASRLEIFWDACAIALVGVIGLRNADGSNADIDRVTVGGVSLVSDGDMTILDEAFPGLIESIGIHVVKRSSPSPK